MLKDLISSTQNPRIKNIVQLIEKSSERRKQERIVVEGARELGLALQGKFTIDSLFVCQELLRDENFLASLPVQAHRIFGVTKNVFAKIALREGSDGITAILEPVFLKLQDVQLTKNPLIIVLEAVEKPGNLGAILRTADAAQADAVIVCDPKTDIYNPNCIRSSVGCVFTNQVVTGSSEEVWQWMKEKNIVSFAAALTAEKFYHETDLSGPTAIVLGTEATGLSEFWLSHCKEQIKIPMLGKIDSLNVSTSAAILVFEAMRQRGFGG